MQIAPVRLWEMYDGLRDQFLFDNDINSIHVLLALYDLEENISNIFPRYICTKSIYRRVRNLLKHRGNSERIARNITYVIHEDINRIELCFYLEGYKFGYYNNKWVNFVEEKALKMYSIDRLYGKQELFQRKYKNPEIESVYLEMMKEIDEVEMRSKDIESLVRAFIEKVIENKINNLDQYSDKQLKLDFDSNYPIIMEESFDLKEDEREKVIQSIMSTMTKTLLTIYKDAAWYAVNDKVLKRYL